MWLRRTGAAILVALLVVLIPVGNETPASAASVSPPVDPSPYLTSTAVRTSAGGAGDPVMAVGTLLLMALQRQKATAAASAVPLAEVPVAAPVTPQSAGWAAKLGAGANVAGWGWMAISAAGGATSLVGNFVGADLDGSMCTGEPWLQTGYSWLTMGAGPSCKVPVVDPNADGGVGWVPFSLGNTLVSGFYGYRSGGVVQRYLPVIARVDAGSAWTALQGRNSSGGWTALTPGCGYSSETGCLAYTASNVFPEAGYQLCVGTASTCSAGTAQVVTPQSTSADPLRDAKCTLTWEDGSITEGFVGQYRQSEGFPVGAVDAACTSALVSKPGAGPDLLPSRISIGDTNTETGAKTEIAGQDVPDFTESERKGLTPGDGTGLRLVKVVGTTVDSCMTWVADCGDWWSSSSNGTNEETYKCLYGGQPVALAECGIYRHTFDTQTDNPTITDPVTGEETQWSNSTDPANEYGTGAQSNQANDRCVTSFSFNPVDWVLRPLRCAFEPRQSKIDQVKGRLNAAWAGAGLGGAVLALGGLFDTFNANVGCGGLPFHLEAFGTTLVDTRLLAACEEPAKGIAATVRTILTIGIVGGGILAVIRYLGALFGFAAFGRVNNGANSGKSSGVHFE